MNPEPPLRADVLRRFRTREQGEKRVQRNAARHPAVHADRNALSAVFFIHCREAQLSAIARPARHKVATPQKLCQYERSRSQEASC